MADGGAPPPPACASCRRCTQPYHAPAWKSPKALLHEFCQKHGALVGFKTVGAGQPHSRVYTSTVAIPLAASSAWGIDQVPFMGQGLTKKDAEHQAAKEALVYLEERGVVYGFSTPAKRPASPGAPNPAKRARQSPGDPSPLQEYPLFKELQALTHEVMGMSDVIGRGCPSAEDWNNLLAACQSLLSAHESVHGGKASSTPAEIPSKPTEMPSNRVEAEKEAGSSGLAGTSVPANPAVATPARVGEKRPREEEPPEQQGGAGGSVEGGIGEVRGEHWMRVVRARVAGLGASN
eukprot:evm.model.scf_2626EXC.1 EVM.evm.TU.scf_2626EXC.1   scf_2626EXC:2346-4130(-)